MRFAVPQLLWLLWTIPLLALLLGWWRRRAERSLGRFARDELLGGLAANVDRRGRAWRAVLRLTALALLVVAAARPQWGAKEVEVEQEGIDVVVALDISRSMLAEDIAPSRLERAKIEVGELIQSLRGDRVGLVFFAGAAFVQCPLTIDYAAARMFLSQADPSLIGTQGTELATALRTAMELFGEESGRAKVVLVVTDGEDFGGGLDEMVDDLREAGVVLYAVGLGTAEGAPIPDVDERGIRSGFVRDGEGNVVISRLEESAIVDLVRATEGIYARAGRGGLDVERLRAEIASLEGTAYSAQRVVSYQERFAWPLAAALLLLIAEVWIRERRKKVA